MVIVHIFVGEHRCWQPLAGRHAGDARRPALLYVSTAQPLRSARRRCSTRMSASGTQPAEAHHDEHATSVWREVGPLLAFSAQTLCIAVTNPLLSLVDTSVVGLTAEAQLAAMTPATALSDGLGYGLTFIPIAVTNLVSLHMARGHPHAAGTVVSDALAISTAICTAIAVGLLVGAPWVLHTLAPAMAPDVLAHAADYVRLRALGLPAALAYSVMQAFFLACQAPRVPLLATIIAALVNLVGDVVLCQGFGMGVRGAAAATSGTIAQ